MALQVTTAATFHWRRKMTARPDVATIVADILHDVRVRGDEAVLDWTMKLDGVTMPRAAFPLRVPTVRLQEAFDQMPVETRLALERAALRIRQYHEAQWPEDFTYYGEDGEQLGMVWRPLARVGVYAPGGRGAYPSTVLMDVIPAQVAGVQSIALASPPGSDGLPHKSVLAAAFMLGVEEVYAVGGAQAIGALAYGTEQIPAVDKIVGPGNIYVAWAKRQVMGDVGIDSIAGPSEVFIVADDTANPRFVAADMLAQAEHDTEAGAVCISNSISLLEAVSGELDRQLETLPRAEIARQALANFGALIHADTFAEAFAILNRVAPEHVEVLTETPEDALAHIQCAGAVFLGHHTPEPVGDYFAGTNHVLPTHGSARYASGLGVHDFLRRMSVVAYSAETLRLHTSAIVTLARAEGLEAHARAVSIRQEADNDGQ